jgi:hypothetical protein
MSAAVSPLPAAAGATGPRTLEGKLASSRNSLQHGLTARELVLSGEDPAAYEALLQYMIEAHQPEPGIETLLVHQIAQSQWRLNRARRLEVQALEADLTAPEGTSPKLDRLLRYIAAIERELHRAMKDLGAHQNARTRRAVAGTKAETQRMAAETRNLQAKAREHDARFEAFLDSYLGSPKPAKLQNEPCGKRGVEQRR